MVEQAERLAGESEFAFFVALESLDREPLVHLLSTAKEGTFEAWKTDGQAPAWFFTYPWPSTDLIEIGSRFASDSPSDQIDRPDPFRSLEWAGPNDRIGWFVDLLPPN